MFIHELKQLDARFMTEERIILYCFAFLGERSEVRCFIHKIVAHMYALFCCVINVCVLNDVCNRENKCVK